MTRKPFNYFDRIIENLNKEFEKIEHMTYEDYQDFEMFAEEMLTEKEYERLNKMLNVQIMITTKVKE